MTTGPSSLRVFVGISLPEPHRAALAEHLDACARVAPAYRWVDPDGLHLTLRFIGVADIGVVDRVRAGLAAVRAAPFRMAVGGRGTFGPRRAPRVVWLAVAEGLEPCRALAADLEARCVAAGLEPEPRPFAAHITLARARREGEPLPELPEPPALPAWTVDDLVLYESRPQQRPRYVALDRYPLRTA